MKALQSPLFVVCAILFLLHQVTQYVFKINIPFADAYLDNLVAMPIILTLLHAERTYLFKKGTFYRLTNLEMILATVYISVLSEILFPLLSPRFIFDWFDFVFFFSGAAVFMVAETKNRQGSKGDKSLRG